MTEPPVTHVEMWREAQRELALRKNFYRGAIDRGQMNPADAARQIRVMEAIVRLLRPLAEAEEAVIAAEKERREPRMF